MGRRKYNTSLPLADRLKFIQAVADQNANNTSEVNEELITFSELQKIVREMITKPRRGFSCTRDGSETFFGGMTPAQALDALENGWKDAPALPELTLPTIPARINEPVFFNDVCGEVLDIGSYSTGSPECFWNQEIQEMRGTKILRLAVEIGGASLITATELQNRGESLIALINSLEIAGYSVELTIVRAFAENLGSGRKHRYLIPVKLAGEVLNLPLMQFVIGHPAFFRRCLFALSEYKMGRSICASNAMTQSFAPEGFIHLHHHDGLSSNAQESIEWAQGLSQTLSAAPVN